MNRTRQWTRWRREEKASLDMGMNGGVFSEPGNECRRCRERGG